MTAKNSSSLSLGQDISSSGQLTFTTTYPLFERDSLHPLRTTQRGKRKLVSRDKFTYKVKKTNKDSSLICQCSVWNINVSCSLTATVKQLGESFAEYGKPFRHESKPGNLV